MTFVQVRAASAEDTPYIVKTWASVMRSDLVAHPLLNGVEVQDCKRLFGRLLEHCDVFVAYPATGGDGIVGFIVVEGSTIHALYVRDNLRRMGVAAQLIQALPLAPIRCSVLSRAYAALISKVPNLTYDPRLLT